MRFEDLNLHQSLAFSLQAAYTTAAISSIDDPDIGITAEVLNKLDDAALAAANALTEQEQDELMELKRALWGVMIFVKAIRRGLAEDLELEMSER